MKTDRIRFHIPITTPEQVVIRDEIARGLAKEFRAVILSLEEFVKKVDGEYHIFPVSVVEVYLNSMSDKKLKYFKELSSLIAAQIGDSVVLEVGREISYIGTAGTKED